MSKIGSVLLIVWGAVNVYGGVAGESGHSFILFSFVAVGLLIIAGGVGLASGKNWGLAVAIFGLLWLSAAALYSGYLLRGWSAMRWTHHALRLGISGVLLAMAATGRSARRATSGHF